MVAPSMARARGEVEAHTAHGHAVLHPLAAGAVVAEALGFELAADTRGLGLVGDVCDEEHFRTLFPVVRPLPGAVLLAV